MNHKYSTYAIVLILFICAIGFSLAFLESSDLDEVCDVDNSIFFRINGSWGCGNLTDTEINVTINNITNLYTNWSVHSDYWDDLNTPYDFSGANISNDVEHPELSIKTSIDTLRSAFFLRNDQADRAGFFFYGSNSPYGYDEDLRIHMDNTAKDVHFTGMKSIYMGFGDVSSPDDKLNINGNVTIIGNLMIGNNITGVDSIEANNSILKLLTDSELHLLLNGTANQTEIYGNTTMRGSAIIAKKLGIGQLEPPDSDYTFYAKASTGSGGYVMALEEFSGTEQMRFRIDSDGDYNIYSDGNSIRIAILDALMRVGIGVLTPVNTLDVEGNMAIGASFSGTKTAPSNGLIIEGLTGLGESVVTSYAHTSSFAGEILYKDRATTLGNKDYTAVMENSVAGVTFTLPDCGPSKANGRIYNIKHYDNTAYNVTISPQFLDTIEGGINFKLTKKNQSVMLQCDAVDDWLVIGGYGI